MTQIELYKALVQKQDELITLTDQASIRGWTDIMWKHRKEFYKEIAELRQQLEKSKETKLSLPLDVPKTREINSTCYNRYKEAYNPDGFSTDAFKEGAKWAIKQIIERNKK